MAEKIVSIERFNGGIAISDKEGIANSFRSGYGANIHDEPSKFTALPKGLKVLGGNVGDTQTVGSSVMNGEIKWIVTGKPFNSYIYAIDENGAIYRENTDGSWQVLRQVANCKGQGLGVYNDYLYYAGNTFIGRYGPLSTAPSFNDSWQTGLADTSALGFAPILAFGKGIAFGNGSNLSWYDGTTFTSQRILLPPSAKCMSLTRIEQYLMIGTVGSDNVFDNDEGFVFAWDGASIQWNYFNNIELGGINAIANYRNQPISVAGTQGAIFLGIDPFYNVHQLPSLPVSSSCQVYPGAITSWKKKIYIGFAANSSDTNFTRGVYAWGAKNNSYPDALSCDYLISTGNSGNTVQITACKGLGNTLYIAWKDGTVYGVDKVTASNNPQASARINFLIFDDNRLPQDKSAIVVRVDHSPLRSGESVSIYTRTDRQGDFTTPKVTHSYSEDDQKSNVTRYPVDKAEARYQEFEWGVSIGCGSTSPEVYGVSFKYDDLREEEAI